MSKKILSVLTSMIVFSSISCAGRTANPVATYQPGDNALSCSGLRITMANVQAEIDRIAPNANKTGKNTALGVAGAFLIVPWFFMDFSGADEIELNAYRRRYNHLVVLYNEKGCDSRNNMMAMPSFEALKDDEEARQKFYENLEKLESEIDQDKANN